MKNLLIIILSVVFISCNAQKLKSMKNFDIETFNKNKNHLNEYNYITKDSTFIEQRKDSNEYYETIHPKNSFFQTINRYYFNGNLKSSVDDFPSNFFHGIYREYNKEGKLIKKTDYNKGYEYSWENLLKFLKGREVKIIDRNTTIRKDEGKWHVWYVKGIYVYNIFIDGKTGEILLDDKDIFEEGS